MGDLIVESVLERYKTRSKIGIAKYGRTLQDNNTDNFLQHLQEELMDAVLYVEKIKSFSFDLINENVLSWAKEKNILHKENAPKQFMKMTEELGEVSQAFLKSDNNLSLEIGDLLVTLTIFAKQNNLNLIECFAAAYEKIKNRTGKTENGVFIKD